MAERRPSYSCRNSGTPSEASRASVNRGARPAVLGMGTCLPTAGKVAPSGRGKVALVTGPFPVNLYHAAGRTQGLPAEKGGRVGRDEGVPAEPKASRTAIVLAFA